jgi:hypothetical protein
MSLFTPPELRPVEVHVTSAPAYNALTGLAALGTANQHFGYGPQTLAELSAEEFALNRTVFDVLGAMLLRADPEQEFNAYLAALEALPPEELRERVLPGTPSREALVAQLAGRSAPPDESDLERALDLLNDPARLQATVVEHLRALWTRLMAEEWRKKSALGTYIKRTLEDRGLPQGDAPSVLRALLGRDLPPAVAADLASVRSIVLVPSPFVALTIMRPDDRATLWVFAANSTLTSWALRQAPLNPGEILSRINPLADKARLRIVELLAQHGELSAQQLIAALELSQSVVSRHLSSLGGYVLERRGEGASKLYRLDPQHIEWTLVMLRQFATPPPQAPVVSLEPASYPPELRRFMNREHRLTQFPTREYDRHLVLRYIAGRMTAGRDYTEREVNDLIASAIAFDDFVTIRRALFNAGYIGREKDGSRYWLIDTTPSLDEPTF